MRGPLAVKVGGSLFDLPHFGTRLRAWLDQFCSLGTPLLLVPGGGATADVIRRLDQIHALGEEQAHWLALRALTLNAHFLASLLPDAAVTGDVAACAPLWQRQRPAVLDGHAFAEADEKRPERLPHRWAVTSDSLAVRAADVAEARQLILLKSVTIPPGLDWTEASRAGFVDGYFAEALSRRATAFEVRAVNLREWRP
jgi:aspartokinase-like uncharacterized kinase